MAGGTPALHCEQRSQLIQNTSCGTGFPLQNLLSLPARLVAQVGVAEKTQEASSQPIRILHLKGSVLSEKKLRRIAEVLHVRPEDDGLGPVGGLEQVVPAGRNQAAPHKDHV